MNPTADRLVAEYLTRLERALRDLPPASRRELQEEIEEHVAAGRAELADQSEAEIRTLLDRIGEPEEIAAAARERIEHPAQGSRAKVPRAGLRELAALPLLLIGGLFLPLLGWLVGVALLWASSVWTRGAKLLGTLIVPGGLAPAAYLVFGSGTTDGCIADRTSSGYVVASSCTGSGAPDVVWVALTVLAIALPLGTALYLALQLRGRFVDARP